MYRRIQTYYPTDPSYWDPWDSKQKLRGCALGPQMNQLGLRAPQLHIQYRGHRRSVKFYFTEEGWYKIGRHLLGEAKKAGMAVQVISVKERNIDIYYRDRYQVAGRIKKHNKEE